MNIALCDDEPTALRELEKKVESFFAREEARVSCFGNGDELLCEMEKKPADIVFLDIQMPGRDGMETARLLRNRGFEGDIIFVTVLPELVYKSFEVEAGDYIVKPVSDERLFGTLGRIVKRRKKGCFMLKCGGEDIVVPLEEILYFEVLDKVIILHERAGVTSFRGSISEMISKIGGDFFRCHRSYIVNLRHIERVGKGEVTIKGGEKIPLSRLRRRQLMEALSVYLGENV